jgi:hypothetical protein
VDAAAKGQDLRDAHKLVGARDQFRICAADTCPSAIQADCANWLETTEKAIPSVVVTAKNGAGTDLVDVAVTVDGQPVAGKLDGQAWTLDPGTHAFHFEGNGAAKLDQRVVVVEGERNQRVNVVLLPAPARGSSSAPPTWRSHRVEPQRVIAVAVGGLSVVSLGVGAGFGAVALSDRRSAYNLCPGSTCPTLAGSQRWSDAASAGNLSTITLAAGAGGLLAAVALWLTAPTARTVQVGLAPGGVTLKGEW